MGSEMVRLILPVRELKEVERLSAPEVQPGDDYIGISRYAEHLPAALSVFQTKL